MHKLMYIIFMLDLTLATAASTCSWAKCWVLGEGQKMNGSSCCDPAAVMYQQRSGLDLNASCEWPDPHCNWTSVDGALQLPTFSTAAKIRVIVTFILCGISTFCNLAVLWAANGHKRKSHVRVLIINLTAADLLVTFIVMPVDAVWNITVQWLAGDLACRFLMFLKLQAMYSCAFVTVVISLDRQSAILNPLGIAMVRKRNRVMLMVAWIMSALLSIPQVRPEAKTHDYSLTDHFLSNSEKVWVIVVTLVLTFSSADSSCTSCASATFLEWSIIYGSGLAIDQLYNWL